MEAALRNRVVIEFTDSSIPPFVCGDDITPYDASIMVNNAKKFLEEHMTKMRVEQLIAKCKEIVKRNVVKSDRDQLNEVIQGLDDSEVQRLLGYLEGWRDSDDE